MNSRRRIRGRIGVAGVVAALTIFGALPATASANPVDDLLNELGLGGSGDQGQGSGQSEASPSNPSNAHAQGTVARVDITAPDGVDDGGLLDDEEAVVGRSRAEQNDDGSYKGHVTILALFGEEIIGIETDAGETANSPFQPLQGLLDEICAGTSQALCVAVLPASSSTGDSGSTNDFGVLRASSTVGNDTIVDAGVAESNASLEDDGQCQTARAGASVARADLLSVLKVRVLQSVAEAVACRAAPGSSSSDSTIASINDQSVPLPGDCADGVNSGFGILSLVSVSCNVAAGVAGTGEADAARDALTVGVVGDDRPVVGATASGTETGASASQSPDTPGDGGGASGVATREDEGEGSGGDADAGGGSAAGEAQPGDDTLAFTGANAALLAIIGLALMGAGIGLAAQLTRTRVGS